MFTVFPNIISNNSGVFWGARQLHSRSVGFHGGPFHPRRPTTFQRACRAVGDQTSQRVWGRVAGRWEEGTAWDTKTVPTLGSDSLRNPFLRSWDLEAADSAGPGGGRMEPRLGRHAHQRGEQREESAVGDGPQDRRGRRAWGRRPASGQRAAQLSDREKR